MYRALNEAAQAEARRLRGDGMTDKDIAARLRVNPRTLRRTLGPRRRRVQVAPPAEVPADWPDERRWPGWTAEQVGAFTGWSGEQAQAFLFAVEGAQRAGSRWVLWYFRRLVEVLRDENEKPESERIGQDAASIAWCDLIAGAPVLAAWLNVADVARLGTIAREREPYVLGTPAGSWNPVRMAVIVGGQLGRLASARQGYASATRPIVGLIRERVESIAFEAALGIPFADRGGPFGPLRELLNVLPMVDSLSLRALLRRGPKGAMLGRTMVNILRFDPPEARS